MQIIARYCDYKIETILGASNISKVEKVASLLYKDSDHYKVAVKFKALICGNKGFHMGIE